MIEGLIGKKLGMTQVYVEKGRLVPVTVVTAGPCRVIQKRTKETNGYEALQLSFEEIKEKKLSKPMKGYYKKLEAPPSRYLKEFKADVNEYDLGTVITAELFKVGEYVDVTGISKGKGFAGVIKRHHFSGGPATHGSMFHREPGSIGSGSAYPSRVRKGKRLPGQMGSKRVTVQSMEIVDVKREEGLLYIRGAVPGTFGSLVVVRRAKKKQVK